MPPRARKQLPKVEKSFIPVATGRSSHFQAGMQIAKSEDFRGEDGPHLKEMAVNNNVAMDDLGTKAQREEGRVWYPKVHEATAKGVREHNLDSILHGAGVVAAVSPNMDFDNANIHAFSELLALKQNPEHMALLHDSLNNYQHATDKNGKLKYLKNGQPQMVQTRSDAWRSVVTKHYPSVAKAPDSNIHKAHRIIDGEHPDDVLDPRTAPKTNSFAHNIADPSATVNPHTGRTLATVDGRAFDLNTNTMRPWGESRGINTSALVGGKATRYEHHADIIGMAARVLSGDESYDVAPSEAQARTWVIAKHREQNVMLGAKRKKNGDPYQGPPRVGQPYLT